MTVAVGCRRAVARRVCAWFAAACTLAACGLRVDVHASPRVQQKRQPTLATAPVVQPEADPATVSEDARRSARTFWATLPSVQAAALERDLDRLEARARRGDAVDAEVAKLRERHPALFQNAASLHSVRWITAGSPGTTQVCTGMLVVGRNGRARCIGALTTRK
jgi:hypothetical protein